MVVGFGRLHWLFVRRTCVMSVLSSAHHLSTTSGVRLRRNWSQFLKGKMYQRLLKNQLNRWWKHLVKNFHTRWQGTENEDCRCSAVQWIKGYSANFNLPVSATNFQEVCLLVSKGQAHDTRAILWSNWPIQSVPVLLRKARRPGKMHNWEENSEIEIRRPK